MLRGDDDDDDGDGVEASGVEFKGEEVEEIEGVAFKGEEVEEMEGVVDDEAVKGVVEFEIKG